MVARRGYIPDRGDVAWLTLDPTRGHEQRGRRPVLVVTPKAYNGRSGLALVCPITSIRKGYPFEITINTKEVSGVALADHIRSVDWKERKLKRIGKAGEIDMELLSALLKKLI